MLIFNNELLFIASEWATSQQPVRPKTEWETDSEAMRARGIIIIPLALMASVNYCFSKIQLQSLKITSRLNIFSKLKLDTNPFLPPKHYKYGGRFSPLVGYNIQPTSSSTNQNTALMIHHQLDFTKIKISTKMFDAFIIFQSGFQCNPNQKLHTSKCKTIKKLLSGKHQIITNT